LTSSVHASANESRTAGIAYHLVPTPVWDSFSGQDFYQPEAYDQDGFIHLTLGTDPLLAVANLFYTGDTRDLKVLVLDLNRIQSPVKYQDPGQIYPHIYGLLNIDAVIGELKIDRTASGEFTSIREEE
jgi:uncharacterized protein (DUF952 family)